MPRPAPSPENAKVRTTVSLPRKAFEVAEKYREMHPEEDLRDFSALVARALLAYAEKRHPDLLGECIKQIRAASMTVVKRKQEIAVQVGSPTIPRPIPQVKTSRRESA